MIDKAAIRKLLDAVATDTTEAFSTSEAIGHTRYHSLYLYWFPGDAANVLTVTIYTSISDIQLPDSAKVWTQDQKMTIDMSGHYTTTLTDIQHTASNTDEVRLRFDFTVVANAVRIGYEETVSEGVLTAVLASKSI